MIVDSPVDEAPPQFSPRMVEHSPSMSHVSPMHTAATLPTVGDAQDDDEKVEMTRIKKRTMLMRFTNNPKPPSVIEAVEEMKNTMLGEVQKATTKLKKTFKARTDKLKGKINGLQAEVSALKEERVKWLEYRREKDRVNKREWQNMNPDK
ncbi:hypothetical protein L6452_18463 [Arctium lappa]|uniref:Uncharacterized protein n=1 Tax=Arctium lappa TaxID=4217 RepID=A0ACB9C6D6_ARCLA|nr:hypothetical protein L6452_18463 [Arctium lappa]